MQCLKYILATPPGRAYIKTHGRHQNHESMSKIRQKIYYLTLKKWLPSWSLPAMLMSNSRPHLKVMHTFKIEIKITNLLLLRPKRYQFNV